MPTANMGTNMEKQHYAGHGIPKESFIHELLLSICWKSVPAGPGRTTPEATTKRIMKAVSTVRQLLSRFLAPHLMTLSSPQLCGCVDSVFDTRSEPAATPHDRKHKMVGGDNVEVMYRIWDDNFATCQAHVLA